MAILDTVNRANDVNYLSGTTLTGQTLLNAISLAQSAAESIRGAGRRLEVHAYTVNVNMPPSGETYLCDWPVLETPAPVIRTRCAAQVGWNDALPTSQYMIQADGRLTIALGMLARPAFGRYYPGAQIPQILEVSYSAGWDFAVDEPTQVEIKTALGRIVQYFEDPRFSGIQSVRTVTDDTQDVTQFATSVSQEAIGLIPDSLLLPFQQYRSMCTGY